MYSTYTKLPSYGFSSTAGVAVVTKVYVASGLGGSSTLLGALEEATQSTEAPTRGGHGGSPRLAPIGREGHLLGLTVVGIVERHRWRNQALRWWRQCQASPIVSCM